jgi:hypothetical protein
MQMVVLGGDQSKGAVLSRLPSELFFQTSFHESGGLPDPLRSIKAKARGGKAFFQTKK